MSDPSFEPGATDRTAGRAAGGFCPADAGPCAGKWRTRLLVGMMLVATHASAACFCAAHFQAIADFRGVKPLPLSASQDDWARATIGMDSSAYLRAAQNFAAGRGITIRETRGGVVQDSAFYYWGPGVPVVLGTWLRWFGGSTMWTFFWFGVVAQFVFGVVATATAALWTRSTLALALVALATGICPPVQCVWLGTGLTSSEIVALAPLSLVVYCLTRGFIAYRNLEVGDFADRGDSWKRPARMTIWFALGGLLIGLDSLIRDSAVVFATFTAIFLVVRALLADRRRFASAAMAGGLLLGGAMAVRLPVELWNRHRIGNAVVCTSSAGCVWHYGLWLPHDQCRWFTAVGIGFGEYLDADAAKRVDQYYRDGRPFPAIYSFQQLLGAICDHPWKAVTFRLRRAPMLWLGEEEFWPDVRMGWELVWCLAFYISLAAFCLVQRLRGREIPEVLYLYLLLLVCASPFIHYEFRYSLPVWNTLVLVPSLLLATLRGDWLVDGARAGRSRGVAAPTPAALHRAA